MENETAEEKIKKRNADLLLTEIEKIEKELLRVSENIVLYTKIKSDKEQFLAEKRTLLDNLK